MADAAQPSPSFDPTVALSARGPSLETGREIGRVRVIGYLGRGGMGEVYEVEHTRLGKRYALKVILPEHAREEGFVERFEREARVTARLEHPNIVRVDDFGEDEGLYWLRMELASGVDAKEVLGPGRAEERDLARARSLAELARSAKERVPEHVVAELAADMLRGLAFAHAQGVVHRDLKPGNVLLDEGPDGRPKAKVSDFGLARVVGEGMLASLAELSMQRSMSMEATEAPAAMASLVGTYEYMAPEQRRGGEVGPASDVYAAGLTIYRLLTGRHAVGFKKPSEVAAHLDPFWDDLLERCLEESAPARPADAGEMLEELEAGVALERPSGRAKRKRGTRRRSGKGKVADALHARTEAKRQEALVEDWPHRGEPAFASPLAEAGRLMASGEEAYRSGRSENARELFLSAGDIYGDMLAKEKAIEACIEAEGAARAEKSRADDREVDLLRPADFEAAGIAFDEGTRARASGDFQGAAGLFEEAADAFRQAEDVAESDVDLHEAVRSAHERASSWRRLKVPELMEKLDRAEALATEAEELLAKGDRDGALARCREAKRLYGRISASGRELDKYEESMNSVEQARDGARELGAERHAPGDFEKALGAIVEARSARDRGDFPEARSALAQAHGALERCGKACKTAVERSAKRTEKMKSALVMICILAVALGPCMVWGYSKGGPKGLGQGLVVGIIFWVVVGMLVAGNWKKD